MAEEKLRGTCLTAAGGSGAASEGSSRIAPLLSAQVCNARSSRLRSSRTVLQHSYMFVFCPTWNLDVLIGPGQLPALLVAVNINEQQVQ